jgi:hypothetical protein
MMLRPVCCALLASIVLGSCNGEGEARSNEEAAELISFHWPVDQPAPGVRICTLVGSGEEIALDPTPIIRLEHIAEAYVAREEDDFVTLRLTEPGRAKLAAATAERIGESLAIVVDDEVWALPLIRSSLDVPELPLMPQQNPAEAERFAARINAAIAAYHGRDT